MFSSHHHCVSGTFLQIALPLSVPIHLGTKAASSYITIEVESAQAEVIHISFVRCSIGVLHCGCHLKDLRYFAFCCIMAPPGPGVVYLTDAALSFALYLIPLLKIHRFSNETFLASISVALFSHPPCTS